MSETESTTTTHSDPRAIWDEKAPFSWLPLWLAITLSAVLAAGFLVGFFLFRSERPVVRVGDSFGGRA